VFSPATPGAADFYRKMPSPTSKATPVAPQRATFGEASASGAEVNPAMFEKAGATVVSPLQSALANKVGRDERFAWITGQLEVENGTFVIYYATPDTVDQYHGRLALQTQGDMSQFQRGDLVTVEGQVQSRVGPRGGAVVYRVANIGLVERQPR
jgi:hypothetical protein